MERLWGRTQPGTQEFAGEPCMEWQGYTDHDGYGRIRIAGKSRYVHVVAYELAVGAIPEGFEVDHLCRNRKCLNPLHLEAVTRRVNSLRSESFAAINTRLTHCAHGHEFTPDNTRVHRYPTYTKRICRACERRRQHEMKERKAA